VASNLSWCSIPIVVEFLVERKDSKMRVLNFVNIVWWCVAVFFVSYGVDKYFIHNNITFGPMIGYAFFAYVAQRLWVNTITIFLMR
jgi:hypothetical protein